MGLAWPCPTPHDTRTVLFSFEGHASTTTTQITDGNLFSSAHAYKAEGGGSCLRYGTQREVEKKAKKAKKYALSTHNNNFHNN